MAAPGGEARRREAVRGLQGATATKTSAKERGKRGLAHRGLGLKGGPAQRQRRRGPAAELDAVVAGVVDAAVLRFLGPTDGFKATLL